MAKERLGSTTIEVDGHPIQVVDIEVETFAAGGNGQERSIIAFRAPTSLPQRLKDRPRRRSETHAITRTYSIPGPKILPEGNIFERIEDVKICIRHWLQKVYGENSPSTTAGSTE